ncbi:MAG: cytochrome c biogenesis protein ResB [Candidatus Omnitrophica bacterium]|nr:cytochrome c biogenesis protein ResB [Candidatus Omnitrophota bacterium]
MSYKTENAMMKFIGFLTSRGFAIFLLSLSAGILIIWNRFPKIYSPVFLIIPACLFLSISFCIARRFKSAFLKNVVDLRFLGSFVFHIGMLVVIASMSLGTMVRFDAGITLPQGMTVNMLNQDFVNINSMPLRGEIPFISMRLDWQKNQYKDGWLPTDYAAGLKISYMQGNSFRTVDETIRINSPVKKNGYEFLLASGSLSPLFVLKDREGGILFNQFVNISNKTSAEDKFEIPERGLTVLTRFFPDMFKQGNKYSTLSKNPDNPAFGLRITAKQDPFKDIWKGVLKVGEKAEFNGMTLEFAELKPVVIIQIVKDPTYYGIVAGWALIVAGLAARYLPRQRLKERVFDKLL